MSRTVLGYFAPTEHRRLNESIGLLLAVVAILMALSLVSFSIDDPSFNIARSSAVHAKPHNFVGIVGAYVADGFFQILGYTSYLIPIFLGVYAFYWLASWPVRAGPTSVEAGARLEEHQCAAGLGLLVSVDREASLLEEREEVL